MRDAGHRTPDIGHRTAKKAKIIYPPPRGVDIIIDFLTTCLLSLTLSAVVISQCIEMISKKCANN